MPYNPKWFTKPSVGVKLNKAHPINRGLQAYWIANEGAGSVLTDVTGNGYNGALTGFTGGATSKWSGSPMGGALMYDGSTNYVSLAAGDAGVFQKYLDYDKPFTISAWFILRTYNTAAAQELMSCLDTWGTGLVGFQFIIGIADRVDFYLRRAPSINVDDGYVYFTGDLNFEVGKLYNVVFRYDGLNAGALSGQTYLNGQPVTTSVSSSGALTASLWTAVDMATLNPVIGVQNNGGVLASYFPGVIDEIRFYNRMLNLHEIQTLYINPHIDFIGNPYTINPTLYGLGAWNGKLTAAGASGTLTANSVNNTIEAYMALSFKKSGGGARYQATGASSAGTASVDVAWPTHAINDIGILLIETANEALGTPAGWTAIYTPTGTGVAGVSGTRLYAFYKRATSSSEAVVATGDSGTQQLGVIVTFRGCKTTGSPIAQTATSVDSGVGTSVSVPGVTTTEDNNDVLYVVSIASIGGFSGESNASVSSLAEIVDITTSIGIGGAIGAWKGLKAVNGASGTLAATVGIGAGKEYLCISFLSSSI